MKYFAKRTSNYWRTLRNKDLSSRSKKALWWVIRLLLVALRILSKLINLFDGSNTGD